MIKEALGAFVADIHILLVDAMQKIDDNTAGILFLVDDNEVLKGVVTDGDIRRWILKNGSIDCEVCEVMNKTPKYISMEEYNSEIDYLAKFQIQVLPILDVNHKIVDFLFSREKEITLRKRRKSLAEVPVVVMAGGKGTRLYPYTKILPKPLIPIGEIPIVERILDGFSEYGVQHFYMTVNYRKEMIKSYFAEEKKKYEIHFVEENKPLGTAGSIKLIPNHINHTFIVTNCDILIRTDYEEFYRFHKESKNDITMITALKHNEIPYGVVYTKEDGSVKEIIEKPKKNFFVNTGMYLLEPAMLELIPDEQFFHMTDLIEIAMQKGYQVGVYPVSEDAFLDMGEFKEMKRMENLLWEQ